MAEKPVERNGRKLHVVAQSKGSSHFSGGGAGTLARFLCSAGSGGLERPLHTCWGSHPERSRFSGGAKDPPSRPSNFNAESRERRVACATAPGNGRSPEFLQSSRHRENRSPQGL